MENMGSRSGWMTCTRARSTIRSTWSGIVKVRDPFPEDLGTLRVRPGPGRYRPLRTASPTTRASSHSSSESRARNLYITVLGQMVEGQLQVARISHPAKQPRDQLPPKRGVPDGLVALPLMPAQ